MKGKSILLALSGSQQSRYAAEICWKLSQELGARLTAQHIVDSHSAWEFLGHEKPGFLDSSRYLTEYQDLCKQLFVLGEELANAYSTEARARGVDETCVVDEGNPVVEICRRAVFNDLVVMGHRPTGLKKEDPRSQFLRLSVAEALSHDCPRPLLVVQDQCQGWESLTIMISVEHINELFINSCLDMATALGLRPALVCLSGLANVEPPVQLIADMRTANPRLAGMPIAVTDTWSDELTIQIDTWDMPEADPSWKGWTNTLIVIPTREIAGSRVTVVGTSPALFVRHLSMQPSILLWPEEHTFSFSASSGSAGQTVGA